MAEPTAAEAAAATEAAAAADAAAAALAATSNTQTDKGTVLPASPSNEPPKVEATDEEKAALAAAEKTAEEAKAKKVLDAKAASDKTAQDEKDKTPLDLAVWGTTGHEGADAALGLLQNAGVTPAEAKTLLFDAVSSGDLSKVDMKALEAKIGVDKAKLVMNGAKEFVKETSDRNTSIIKDISTVAGGDENWTKVAAWAKANMDGDALSEYREMIDSGGAQARFAAGEIVTAYNADDGNSTLTTTTDIPPVDGDTTTGASGVVMTRKEYAEATAKAHQHGRVPPASELEALNAARARGRAKGV